MTAHAQRFKCTRDMHIQGQNKELESKCQQLNTELELLRQQLLEMKSKVCEWVLHNAGLLDEECVQILCVFETAVARNREQGA